MYLVEIDKIDEALYNYQAVICDIWGVLHDGVTLHHDAVAALRRAKAKGKKVILLTNAPKCSDVIINRFAKMGAKDAFWDAVVTSGDTVNHYLIQNAKGKKVFHWGLDDDRGLYADTDVTFVNNPLESDMIVCTGLLHGTSEISITEAKMIQDAAEVKIPFLCTNPDRSVRVGDKFEFCAGTLADLYIELGGSVEFFGKPYPAVYERCFELLDTMKPNIMPQDILVIGDGLNTDIRGGHQMGMDTVLIKDGLHQELFKAKPHDAFRILREVCELHDVMPEYVMSVLK